MYTFPQPIYVTSPLLPPLPLIYKRLEDIWNAQWLTNMGKQHGQLESALQNHLGVPKLSLLCNGTIALLVAGNVLGLKGYYHTVHVRGHCPFHKLGRCHACFCRHRSCQHDAFP